ncbi:MAG: hypothetical protein MJ211_15990 [Bacteroidales bacterium]|nr:hypothetical protein [Bacteroidales bacterium]
MALTKVLITVMTYPTLSEKHFETVCTAGFREDGSWIRIFPVPHRLLPDIGKYSKWQWIEADLEQNPNHDDRPESFHIKNIDSLKLLERIDIKGKPDWGLRQNWVNKNKVIYKSMTELLSLTKANKISLAVLKPSRVVDVICEKEDMQSYFEKLNRLKQKYDANMSQLSLFETQEERDYHFKFAEKIPYKFRYVFYTEGDEKPRKLMIEDWEIGQLYRNNINSGKSEEEACNIVKDKYLKLANENNIHFFMGTSYQWQKKNAPDPYLIIGVFFPPKHIQMPLF